MEDEDKKAEKISKNLAKARALVEPRPYALADAVPLLQKAKYAKFDDATGAEFGAGDWAGGGV